ncbi:MAG: AgmX/PglI C-terminal domain-containing protein, partial [bacterium]
FTIILILTILVDCLTIAYLMSTEMSAEHVRKRIAAVVRDQTEIEREAKFVDAPAMPDLPPETEASSPSAKLPPASKGSRTGGVVSTGGARSGGAGTITDGGGADTGPVSPSRRTREDISNTASRAGILGLLTSNSGQASGLAAEDVLGSNASVADIDQALANAGGLRRGSSGELNKAMGPGGDVAGSGVDNGREVRGGRATNAGGIDALVQGLGEGRAQGVQRSGGLEVGSEEPLIEEGEDGKATGTRDRDAVAAVVAKHTSAIQFCYQRELKRSPNLKGKVVVRFVITPLGEIESVAILASTLSNPTVENCIAERIKRWDDFGAIDPAKGNTTFRQVYTFGY